jgi:sugar phosphate isomerase/epimerase
LIALAGKEYQKTPKQRLGKKEQPMRFGIMSTQMNALIPPGLSPQEMLTHVTKFDQSEVVREMVELGFNPLELNGDLEMFLPHLYSADEIEKLVDLRGEIGAAYTIHLPLWSVEPSTPMTPVRLGSVEAVINSIEATRPLQPEMYVLHATGALGAEFYRMNLPETAKTFILGQFQNNARESLDTILEKTGIPSRRLAIETVEFPLDLTLELAVDLDLSICFDTGHVLVGFSGPVDLFEALEQCLPRLGEIHLHDGPWYGKDHKIGYGKDHQALGKGDLDIARLLDRLMKAGFDGPVIFELSANEALTSMDRIRSLRPEVLKKN